MTIKLGTKVRILGHRRDRDCEFAPSYRPERERFLTRNVGREFWVVSISNSHGLSYYVSAFEDDIQRPEDDGAENQIRWRAHVRCVDPSEVEAVQIRSTGD